MKKSREVTWVGPVRRPRNRYPSHKKEKPKALMVQVEEPTIIPEISTPETKSTDFVLVYRSTTNEKTHQKIETFVFNLEQKGFELETSTFSINDEINFIRIHAPTKIIVNFAALFGIELSFQNVHTKIRPSKPYKFMATEVTIPDVYGTVYHRAKETLSGSFPKTVTSSEKGLIIYKVLSKNPYGDQKREYGIEKLINSKVFEAAFPLHDGPCEWTEEGPLNDRQLLTKYWSDKKCWNKQQPIDLVEKYFGPETSFYFAWFGFYNKMLVIASAAGVIFFILGIPSFRHMFAVRLREVCESEIVLCPNCIVEHCKYEMLKSACLYSRFMYLLDNPLVISFAALMSVWSTLFLVLWRREEAMLQIRWNVRSIETDCSMRPEFEETATHHKFSKATGMLEPYMTRKQMCFRYSITFSAIFLFMTLMALGIFGVIVYVKTVSVILTKSQGEKIVTINVNVVASASGAVISSVFILIVDFFYEKVSLRLTKLENPRTQMDFDNSYAYKSYAIAFVNNYCVIFYIAFFKARFYTYPGDKSMWDSAGGVGSALCSPAGCLIDLTIQLVIILLVKSLAMNAKQYIVPQLLILVNKYLVKKVKDTEVTLQWERDYLLNDVEKYHIMGELMDMMIQYGFVSFFVAAFPLTPLLALLNNLIELRIDAVKLTRLYRRPVALKVPNLAAWDGILEGITYIGVATNAFVIAFTSEFVQRTIFRFAIRYDLKGYENSLLSAYNVSEFPIILEAHKNITVCYYPGKRYPPDHPRRYELTEEHWFILTIRFLVVIIFEHAVLTITRIVSSMIPDVPFAVKELINYQKYQIKEMRLGNIQDSFMEGQENRKFDIFREI